MLLPSCFFFSHSIWKKLATIRWTHVPGSVRGKRYFDRKHRFVTSAISLFNRPFVKSKHEHLPQAIEKLLTFTYLEWKKFTFPCAFFCLYVQLRQNVLFSWNKHSKSIYHSINVPTVYCTHSWMLKFMRRYIHMEEWNHIADMPSNIFDNPKTIQMVVLFQQPLQ